MSKNENREPKYLIDEENAKLHISKGNNKLGKGIYNFSSLPGDADHLLEIKDPDDESGEKKILLTSIPGTCSGHCSACFNHGCYAVNSARLHHNAVIPAWGENTLLLRSGIAFELLDKFISDKNKKYKGTHNIKDAKVRIFRINVSGEIENEHEFEEWNDLATKHPEVTFGLYTKNFEALDQFMQKHEDTVPNFVINISQWHGVADQFLAKYPGKFNVFEYDNSNRKNHGFSDEDIERLSHVVHCPAVDRQGHHVKRPGTDENITCDHCGRCYRKTGETTAVWDH